MKYYFIGGVMMLIVVTIAGLFLQSNPTQWGFPLGISGAASYLIGYFISKLE